MTSIVESIRQNDPEFMEIRLTEDPIAYCADMTEFIDALAENTVISYLRLDRDFIPCMKEENVSSFFKTVGNLPALKEMRIWHASLPVIAVANFLQNARQLEFLELGCLDLEGTEEDFKLVSAALKEHPSLKHFALIDFSLNDDTVKVDELIETLATIPNLEVVKLEVTSSRRVSLVGNVNAARQVKVILTGNSLATLCVAPKLKELLLNRLTLKLEDFNALATALKTSPSLTRLALPHCGLDDDGADALAQSLGDNSTLALIDLTCNKLTDEGCITLATALRSNKSVKTLRLWGNVKISNAGFEALAEIVETSNCVLERVPLMLPSKVSMKPTRSTSTNQAA